MNERKFQTTGTFQVEEHVDLETCHEDPIHQTVYLQPHGTFLEVDPGSGTVRSAAANVESFLNVSCEEVIGESMEDVFSQEIVDRLIPYLQDRFPLRRTFVFGDSSEKLIVSLFPIGETAGIELEPFSSEGGKNEELRANVGTFLNRLQRVESFSDLFDQTVRVMKIVSGFDRVMLYKFDPEGNGSVVAEEKQEGVRSYLGQHFPSSDIPEPARRLYRENALRYIQNAEYEPVPIHGADGKREREEMDMTYSSLRSVPRVHRQYLQNMGVQSSLSVSLMVKEELWGLITCHGVSAQKISWPRRMICRQIGQSTGQQIARLEAEQRERKVTAINTFRQDLEGPWKQYDQLFEELEQQASTIRSIIEAEGFYLEMNDRHFWSADSPVQSAARELVPIVRERLKDQKLDAVRSIVDEIDEDWSHSEDLSGYLAVRMGASARAFCVWFRAEHKETLEWGGDPRNPVEVDEEGKLSPRSSFEAWTQEVARQCRRWSSLDQFSARELVRVFNELGIEVQSRQLLAVNQRVKEKNEALREAKDHLEQVNEEKEELVEKLKKIARTDELTGLFNRKEVIRRLKKERERGRRYEQTLSVAILDLDHFKKINDRYGHQVGDKVLRETGELLRNETREIDFAGRYGGEEFAIVFPVTELEGANVVAERIRKKLREKEFEAGGETFQVTCSIGVSELKDPEETIDSLIQRADQALYKVKKSGRDGVQSSTDQA